MNNSWKEMMTHVQALEEFVHTWTTYEPQFEDLPRWRNWHGEKVHVDHIYAVVSTALYCMTDGQWRLAAELLDIVASVELVDGDEGEITVERFRWGAS